LEFFDVDVLAKFTASHVFARCVQGVWARREPGGCRARSDAGSGPSGSISSREPQKATVMVQDIARTVPDRKGSNRGAGLGFWGDAIMWGEGSEAGAPPLGSWREDEFAEVELRKRAHRGVGSSWSVLEFVAEVLQGDIR
jgi:hypothetical protein